jgi:hypothetical protein
MSLLNLDMIYIIISDEHRYIYTEGKIELLLEIDYMSYKCIVL